MYVVCWIRYLSDTIMKMTHLSVCLTCILPHYILPPTPCYWYLVKSELFDIVILRVAACTNV